MQVGNLFNIRLQLESNSSSHLRANDGLFVIMTYT